MIDIYLWDSYVFVSFWLHLEVIWIVYWKPQVRDYVSDTYFPPFTVGKIAYFCSSWKRQIFRPKSSLWQNVALDCKNVKNHRVSFYTATFKPKVAEISWFLSARIALLAFTVVAVVAYKKVQNLWKEEEEGFICSRHNSLGQ